MDTDSFPDSFSTFLDGINGSKSYYKKLTKRYVRLKPGKSKDLAEIMKELPLDPVAWMPDFFSLPIDVKLSSSHSYKGGEVYGLDVSSGLAVRALEITQDDQVLDVCCAPGAKLCYMADLIGQSGTGIVTGVDISLHRLNTCKSVIRKYKHNRVRLFQHDGTTFNVPPPTRVGKTYLGQVEKQVTVIDFVETCAEADIPLPKRNNAAIKPFHAGKLVREDHQTGKTLYDKVLVDAECTHDGSIAHIEKYITNGWEKFDERFLNPERLDTLHTLQRGLLQNGNFA
jgi:16S rRNA C967 or C1407 C5-methylase (RsmB/RsmF family)